MSEFIDFDCPIHDWFELSYAQYLTIPRTVLEQMPKEWKTKFALLLDQLDETLDWRPSEGRYWVALKDSKGRYKKDKFANYRQPVKVPKK
jgi:hypothetical protein